MRTLVIGDIHGCLVALNRLLDAVHPATTEPIVFLGDYVDRGPDTKGVLDRLIELQQSHTIITLMGNHEEMMLDARGDMSSLRGWCMCGGEAALRSYNVAASPIAYALALQQVPDEHWAFLTSCREYLETPTHIFVHGQVDEDVPMQQQETTVLRWKQFKDPKPHCSGKQVICGHTAQRDGRPLHLGHATCIDTCAYGGGWLTCLDVTTGRLWQANQQGQVQGGHIESFRR